MGTEFELQTDTHLSKDFNKVLQSCMIACNNSGTLVESSPHYDMVKAYYASVNTFFKNTFFMFETLVYNEQNYSQVLMDKMQDARKLMKGIERDTNMQRAEYLDELLEICNFIHMMIMSGLQQRRMLVRMSETEPKGARSIEHWNTRASFRKGEVKYRNVNGRDVV